MAYSRSWVSDKRSPRPSAGLRATQSSLSLVAGNIANAETPGYVKKTATQVATAPATISIGVRVSAVNRELDQYRAAPVAHRDVRRRATPTCAPNSSSACRRSSAQPGVGQCARDRVQQLHLRGAGAATSPPIASARYGVLTAAQTLAQHLNGMTADIQGLRSDAELGLSDAVSQANEAMQRIAAINQQLGTEQRQDATTAKLRDQRDQYIDQLAQLMNIKVVPTDHNQINGLHRFRHAAGRRCGRHARLRRARAR